MANVYKGLTVQFGGDTSELQQALKKATSAASDAQSQLRKLNNALTFDDDNVVALKQKFSLLGDSIGDASNKLELYTSSFESLGDQVVSLNGQTTTIRDLADQTENIGLAASTALDAYNNLNSKLEQVNRYLEDLRSSIGTSTDDWELFNKKVKDMDGEEIAELVERLERHNVLAESAGDAILELKGSYQEVANTNAVYTQVKQFENLQTSIAESEGQIEKFTAELVKMDVEPIADLASNFDESVQHVSSATEAIEKGSTSIDDYASIVQKLDNRIESNSENFELYETRIEALGKQYDATSDKAQALFEAMGFDASTYDGVDKSTESVVEYQLAVEDGTISVKDLKEALGLTDSEADSMSGTLEALTKTTTQLHEEVEKSAAAYAEAKSDVDVLTTELEAQENALREYLTQLGLSGDQVDTFCQSQGSMRDRLVAALEAMDLASTGLDQYGQLADMTTRELEGLIKYVSNETTAQTEATNAMRDAIEAGEDFKWSDYNTSLLQTTSNVDDFGSIIKDTEIKIADAQDELRDAENTLANSKVSEEIGETRDEIVDLFDEMEGLYDKNEASTQDLADALDKYYKDSMDEMSSLTSDLNDYNKKWDEMEDGIDSATTAINEWGNAVDDDAASAMQRLEIIAGQLEQSITDAFSADYARDFISEMNNIDSAVQSLQSELSKVDAALQLDPTNTELVNTKMGLLEETTRALETEIDSAEAAFTDLGNTSVKLDGVETTVAELSEQTNDAVVDAAKAESEYSELTTQLKAMCDPITEATQLTGDLDDSFDLFATMGTESTSEIISKLQEMGYVTEDQAQQLQEVADAWSSAKAQMDATEQVTQYKQLGTQLQTLKANASDAANQLAQMELDETLSSDVSGISGQVEILDSRLNETQTALSQVQKKMELDPSNVTLSAEKTQLLQQYTDTASEKMKLLSDRMDTLKSSGIESSQKSMAELEQDVDDATADFKECTARVEELEAELAIAKQKGEELADSTDDMDGEYADVAVEVADLEIALGDAKTAQKEAASALKDATMAQEYNELNSDLSDTETALLEVKSSADKASGSLTDMATSSESATSSTFYGFEDLGNNIKQIGDQMFSALESVLDSARDVDEAFINMKKTTDGTEEEFEDLKEAAYDCSTQSAISADTILEIEQVGGELGLAADQLEDFSEQIGNLSLATDLNADEAAEEVGSLVNLMDDLEVDNLEGFSDALVRLGNNGASTESDIMDVATRIAAVGNNAGFTTPEILAWASSLASLGSNSEAAGTALTNTMTDIELAVAEGGDSLDSFAEIAGMSAEEFATSWEEDPSSTMQAFIEGLDDLDNSGESSIEALEELGITSVRQLTNIENLAGATELLDDNLEMSQNAWDGVSDEWGDAGDAANEADQASEGLSGTLTIIENTITVLSSQIGEALLPMIQDLSDFLISLTDDMDNVDDGLVQNIAKFALVATAMGTVTSVAGTLGNGLKSVKEAFTSAKTGFSSFQSGLSSVITKVTGTSTSLSGLSGALTTGLVGVGIAAAIAGIAYLIEQFVEWQEEQKEIENATDGLIEATEELGDTSIELDDDALLTTEDLVEDVRGNLSDLADEIDDLNEEVDEEQTALNTTGTVLSEYLGQSNLTQGQVSLLEDAVEDLNESCDTNYELVQDESGAYYLMQDGVAVAKDEIYELIEAQKLQTQIDAATETLTDLYAQQADAAAAVTAAQTDYNTALDDFAESCNLSTDEAQDLFDSIQNGDSSVWDLTYDQLQYYNALDDTNGTLEEAQSEQEALDTSIENTEDAIEGLTLTAEGGVSAVEGWALTNNTLMGSFSELDYSLDDFAEKLSETGVSTDDLERLTSEDLNNMALAYDGTIDSILVYLEEFGITGGSTAYMATANVTDQMAAGLTDGSIDIDTEMDVIQAMITGDWDTVNSTLTNAGLDVDESIIQGMIDGEGKLDQESANLIATMMASMDTGTLSTFAEELGLALPDGMIEGIENGDDPSEWIDALCQAMIDQGIVTLDTGSPSKEFETIGQAIPEGLEKGLNESEAATTAVEEIESLSQSLIDTASDVMSNFGTEVSTAINESDVSSISETMSDIGTDAGDNFASGISDSTGSVTSAVNILLNAATSNIGASFQNSMTSKGESGAKAFVQAINNKQGAAKTAGETLGKKVWNGGLGNFDEKMKNAAKEGVSAFIEGLEGRESKAKEAGKSLGKKVWNGGLGSDFRDNMKDAGKKGAQNFVNGAKDSTKLEAAYDAGESLATKAYNGAKSKNGDVNKSGYAYYAGVQFAKGFGNGINDTSSWVYDIAYDLAEQAVKAANDAQDSASPSKVMEQVGQWYGEGYIEGIESEYDEIERAASQAAALAIEAATTDAVSSISYETTAQAATASAVLEALDRLDTNTSKNENTGTVVNQTFQTKVVRSDSDLYTAAPIIYRNAMREAARV